jgi:hypothetical protein
MPPSKAAAASVFIFKQHCGEVGYLFFGPNFIVDVINLISAGMSNFARVAAWGKGVIYYHSPWQFEPH